MKGGPKFSTPLSKSVLSIINLHVIIDPNMSFCRERLGLSSEKKDSSKCINLLQSYGYFTNHE
jgi:hypothetical protein